MLWIIRLKSVTVNSAWVFITLALSSCVLTSEQPEYQSQLPTSPRWHNEDNTTPEALGWFSAFNHDEVNQLTKEALENNPELSIAKLRLEQRKAEVDIQSASFFPSLNLFTDASRTKSSSKGFDGQRIKTYENSFKVGTKISWEADLWGRLRSKSEAFESALYQSELDYKYAKLSIITRTTQQWIEVVASSKQEEISRQQTANLSDIVERTKHRYREGLLTILDLRLVETDLANAKATLYSRIKERKETSRKLELLLGRYPSGSFRTAHSLPDLTQDYSAGIPSELLANRPDLLSAEQKIIEAHNRVNAAEADRLPRITLSQTTTYQNSKIKELFDPYSLIASIAGGLIQPIFDGGRRSAIVIRNKANTDEKIFTYLQTVLKAYDEVEASLTNEALLTDQLEKLTEATSMATQGELISREKYFSGLISTLDHLQAQQRLFISQSRLINIKKQRLQSRATLYLALGGQTIPLSNFNKPSSNNGKPN